MKPVEILKNVIIGILHFVNGFVLFFLFGIALDIPYSYKGSFPSLFIYDKSDTFIMLAVVVNLLVVTSYVVTKTKRFMRIISVIFFILYLIIVIMIEYYRIGVVIVGRVDFTSIRIVLDLGLVLISITMCLFAFNKMGWLTSRSS